MFFTISKGEEPFSRGVDIFTGNQIKLMIGIEGIDFFSNLIIELLNQQIFMILINQIIFN